jgi:HK97 family phage major capsid protein
MRTKELRQKRAALYEQVKGILKKAEGENRALTAEEQEQTGKIEADMEALRKTYEAEERAAEVEKELSESIRTAPKPTPETAAAPTEKRATKEYVQAFSSYLRTGSTAELRAMQVGDLTEGGTLVPTEFEKQLIQALNEQNVMRPLCTVISTAVNRDIPVISSHGSAAWTAEEAAANDSQDVTGKVTLNAYKLTRLVKVSEELITDSAFDLQAYLNAEFARSFGAAEEAGFVNGSGSGQPTGIVGGATVGVTTASASAITSDEIIGQYHALPRQYRANAVWLMADTTAMVLRKLKNSVSGDYHWQPGLQASEPDRLMGKPVYYSSYVPAIAATAKVAVFGDFKFYWIADRQGRTFQRLNELYAANGQVGFRGAQRVDGKLLLADSCRSLVMHA